LPKLEQSMRFLDTLFRHRWLALIPIGLGLVLAGGYALVQPRAFQTSASLWINSNTPGQNPNAGTSNQYVDPSTQQENILRELLTTRSFALAVGHDGPLGAYLAKHSDADVKGLAAEPGLGALFSSGSKSLDDRITTELPTDVTLTAPGPQVVTITVKGPSASVAVGTTNTVIKEYTNQVVAALRASDQVAVSYYAQQLSLAQTTQQNAQQALATYQKDHPNVAASDATLQQMQQATDLAEHNYGTQLQQYQQAQLNLANASNYSGFQVIDRPVTPSGPVSRLKNVITAGVGGLVIGLIIALLIISALSALDGTVRRPADIKRAIGVDAVAGINNFHKQGAGS
jgi:uncharacterized protein involved in exopolysaccharide biosynthesis